MKEGDSLTPLTIKESGYDFIAYPPYQGAHDPTSMTAGDKPLKEILLQLHPATPQVATNNVEIDRTPTITANVLQIDVHKDNFDRARTTGPRTEYDPPIGLVIKIANSVITRIRSVTQGVAIKPLVEELSFLHLQYLTDTEEELKEDPALFKDVFVANRIGQATGISSVNWSVVNKLADDYKLSEWRVLLYDATAMLPEVGPSIVLAFTALETLIEATLRILVKETVIPDNLWKWIKKRDNANYKEPSVADKFDVLLEAVAGNSLKSNNALWEGFTKIKAARNTFVHEGVPIIDGEVVTYTKTLEIIKTARDIIEWTEALLPAEFQPPELEGGMSMGVTLVIR